MAGSDTLAQHGVLWSPAIQAAYENADPMATDQIGCPDPMASDQIRQGAVSLWLSHPAGDSLRCRRLRSGLALSHTANVLYARRSTWAAS
jgi:hypothetical protein